MNTQKHKSHNTSRTLKHDVYTQHLLPRPPPPASSWLRLFTHTHVHIQTLSEPCARTHTCRRCRLWLPTCGRAAWPRSIASSLPTAGPLAVSKAMAFVLMTTSALLLTVTTLANASSVVLTCARVVKSVEHLASSARSSRGPTTCHKVQGSREHTDIKRNREHPDKTSNFAAPQAAKVDKSGIDRVQCA